MIYFFIIKFFLLLSSNATSGDTFKIAFGSCLNEEKEIPIWDSIEKFSPNVFVFLGDNVYGDRQFGIPVKLNDSLKSLENAYSSLNRHKKRFNQFNLLMTWDDHDYGYNDFGKDYPYKIQSKKLFLDFWEVKKSDSRWSNEDGIYYAKDFKVAENNIRFILLDTRYNRSALERNTNRNIKKKYIPTTNLDKTILGENQWKWFKNNLDKKVDLIIVASSIQVLPQKHGWEKWANFPHERKRLLDLITKTNNKVIILSGDRHFGAIYETRDKDNKLVEFTSSGLNTYRNSSDPIENAISAQSYSGYNFGGIEINFASRKINGGIYDGKGNKRISKELGF